MQTYSPGAVVVVPFPFTDQRTTKRRPALVCSTARFNAQSGHLILAMITTAKRTAGWSGDVTINGLSEAGLPAPSVVRWKLFTLPESFILRQSGELSESDREQCRKMHPIGF